MDARRQDLRTGICMIVLGCLLGSAVILFAFTLYGFVAAPFGIALIVFGALRIDRAKRG